MSKLDNIILSLVAGAMEFQNPSSVTPKGAAIATGPKTAKQNIKDLMVDIIGNTTEGRSKISGNELILELRQKVNEL